VGSGVGIRPDRGAALQAFDSSRYRYSDIRICSRIVNGLVELYCRYNE
jgi:hypothetical protein